MANQSAGRPGVVRPDTIAAAATASGRAAVGIVRISGSDALQIAAQICGRKLRPRLAEFCRFRAVDGELIDEGLALAFAAPASFTGEDVVELQAHGSPVIIDWLLETVFAHGARPAEAGEFSLRAFLNDKLDLTQAEAIGDLIDSGSRSQARAARRSLTGEFSTRVDSLQQQLTALRVHCESWLDFPDEDIDHAAVAELEQSGAALLSALQQVERQAAHGRRLNDGLNVAIAGRPNAGKSSLLNRLAGADTAIVTEVAGTTRDTLRESLLLDGAALTLVDMAGLRATEDRIEGEGIRRAQAEIEAADHVLWVADIAAGLDAAQTDARRTLGSDKLFTIVLNKIDTLEAEPNHFVEDVAVFALSAKTGAGIEVLRAHLKSLTGTDDAAGSFSARRRHLDALERARGHIHAARSLLAKQLELAAEELKLAQASLDELTGEHTSDDLLGEIFANFCIGK